MRLFLIVHGVKPVLLRADPSSGEWQWEQETVIGGEEEAKLVSEKSAEVTLNERSGLTATAIGDKIYLIGGQEPATGACFNDVLIYDTSTKKW